MGTSPSTRREIYRVDLDRPDELLSDGYTSDEAALTAGETLAWKYAHIHVARMKGEAPAPEDDPPLQIVARGLRLWPHVKSWFPYVMAMFGIMKHRPPADVDMPKVHDYRTAAGRRIRARKAEASLLPHPWSHPKVRALGETNRWPRP